MNENINLCAILKDTPKGTLLYSPLIGEVKFDEINNLSQFPVHVIDKKGDKFEFTQQGTFFQSKGECLLFPSKDQKDWSKYQRPFVNGDIITSKGGGIALFSHIQTRFDCSNVVYYHCVLYPPQTFKLGLNYGIGGVSDCRLAAEEEKQKLFQAIQDNGYKWNAETKTLELIRPKFEDGDIVATHDGKYIAIIKNDTKYYVCCHLNSNYFHLDQSGWFDRLATEEEKQKLFQVFKDRGYKWNDQLKSLEVLITPNFKVGDIIWDKDYYKVKITNVNIEDSFYTYESLIAKGIGTITFNDQYDWELVEYQVGDHFINPSNNSVFVITKIQNNGNYSVESLGEIYYPFEMKKLDVDRCTKINKWNPKRFKPFDKVLTRDTQRDSWIATLFSHIGNSEEYPYVTTYVNSRYCIPYNIETEHLVGTTLEEPEFYKC